MILQEIYDGVNIEKTKLEQSIKDKDLIDIGDKVEVSLDGVYFKGIVKYKPVATHDCWIFENIDDKSIRYVQNYIQIVKYPNVV
ncbi:MAG: hypothetical protein Q7R95_10595 [bacterium]|nr:hypothetical protein [bacterium]